MIFDEMCLKLSIRCCYIHVKRYVLCEDIHHAALPTAPTPSWETQLGMHMFRLIRVCSLFTNELTHSRMIQRTPLSRLSHV